MNEQNVKDTIKRLGDHGFASSEQVVKELWASLAVAERRADDIATLSQLNFDMRQEAERRLSIAREALERIAGGWGGPLDTGMRLAREALAALDGEANDG